MDKKEKLLIEIVCIIVLSNFLCMFCFLIIPGLSEPPVRTLRATCPENESHIFR